MAERMTAPRPDVVEVVGPASSFYVSQRLRLHYVDWGNEEAPLLLLVHGGRDHARSWDWVARELRRDWHVIAPDLRGHGDSDWALGGSYSMAEFVLDLARLVEFLGPEPVALLGHSLGGAIVLQYAGLRPERVRRLVAIEGLGASPALRGELLATPPWERLGRFVDGMRRIAGRQPRRYESLELAAARMREENDFLSEAQALHLTRHGVRRNEDGTFSWKFDNYVHAPSAARPDFEGQEALWGRIDCPVLLVRGAKSWASDPVRDGRAAAFRDARLVNVEGAGHWVHHDRLEAFLEAVDAFL
jgi:pimeloyl-ACP methyl ester carboxylesterase